ncbi:MAG: 23S rRNA (uracil-5-)-methyltransferase RumA, partial [Bacteroidetes bacterium]|nr:23S rRNA (uracil-5-)-methyltransferase RumA [Bacteroidota bacterium]
IGMEQITEAVEDAKVNSNINQLYNTEFLSGDIKDLLHQAVASDQPKPDVIITDPPRVGMHPQVVQHLLTLEGDKIVYISCNPATQARDLALLDEKYAVMAVQPVDMFPHTHHVENIVLLSLKSKV